MGSDYKIFWTDEAIRNLESILDYLTSRWAQKEVNKFKYQLGKQIELIQRNPRLFPYLNTTNV